ncbi:MAG: alpha/beta hydrolase [Myxococcaceae bacterium]|nr:alpha/beta hydrolase [Myxococcaceae bacterium]
MRLVLLIAVLAFAGCKRPAAEAAPPFALTPCRLDGVASQLRCGTVEVWEDRAAKQGRRLKLKVAVAPALAPQPEPDAVFVLAGGPGQAATEVASAMLPALERVRRKRDIVFVDQRGTGASNGLDCMEPSPDAGLAERLTQDMPVEALRRCLAGYDADVRLYSTPLAMDDLDEVREVLGYPRINLYGVSYGTRAALEYLRRHGDHARTAVLDGVAPMSLYLPLSPARDAQRALELLFRHCAEDAVCDGAFPRLSERFQALLTRLERTPEHVRAPHPVTGEPLEVTVDRELFVGNLRALLYVPEMSALAPLLIDRAERGDWRPFLGLAEQLSGGFVEGMSLGLFLSVVCTEDAPFVTPDAVARDAAGTWVGEGMGKRILEACGVWPKGELPAGYREPVRTEVPVLLLSGELDPVTPPSWGEDAARTLTHSLHVVVPAVGHGAWSHACARDLVRDFVSAGRVEGLRPTCGEAAKRPPFFIHFAGPTP